MRPGPSIVEPALGPKSPPFPQAVWRARALIGAVLAPLQMAMIVATLEVATVAVGLFAVSALIRGAVILVRETRLAVQILGERADAVRRRLEQSSR